MKPCGAKTRLILLITTNSVYFIRPLETSDKVKMTATESKEDISDNDSGIILHSGNNDNHGCYTQMM